MDIAEKFSILVTNKRMWCPMNPLYGAEVPRFVTSKIFTFGNKRWQLRSIQNKGTDKWHVFPFLIDTCGCEWNTPIISDPVLRFLGYDRESARDSADPSSKLVVPQPLKIAGNPFKQDWGSRGEFVAANNLIFNMIGSQNAVAVELIEGIIGANPQTTNAVVKALLSRQSGFQHIAMDEKQLDEHIDEARKRAQTPQNWMDTWDQVHLPIDPAETGEAPKFERCSIL
jgi:hypothetical protein